MMNTNDIVDMSDNHSEVSNPDSTTEDREPFVDEPPKQAIGAEENKKVVFSRYLVVFVLVVCAASAAALTYLVTEGEEQNNFERDFAGIASEIIEVSQTAEDNLVKIMHDYGTALTSTALSLNQTWPYVTIPDFYRKSMASMDVSGGKLLSLVLAVEATDESRAAYNRYASENIGWYYESHELAGTTPIPVLPIMVSLNPEWDGDLESETPPAIPSFGDELHLVQWQVAPPPFREDQNFMLNVDWRHAFTERWNYMSETRRTARSPIVDLNAWLPEPTMDPMNLYYQPIFKDFSDDAEAVAFVHLALRWQDHFENLLHDDVTGIIIVLESTCGDMYTFRIDGPEANVIGEGDLHDPRYDYLKEQAGLTLALNEILQGSTISEQGISCGYSLTVYPSAEFESSYHTWHPWGYMLVVLGIFFFTSAVFVIYDKLVSVRQDVVLESANQTDAIVSSLFPDQFRQQMINNAKEDARFAKMSKVNAFHAPSVRNSLNKFCSAEVMGAGEDNELNLTKPVADLFPSATVLCADICGFTAWSSIREPTQVFTLLESIYSAFDLIAKKRQVYKVETVGDSYVAVAGVPNHMANHAVAMSRFARDCAFKLPQIVHRLERFLGPGTADITMRFGLHSGPVTAGVLRGDKARFQLFGDTVNTCSLIGRSGEGSRIHISDTTANLLAKANKQSWFEPRPDLVNLKGKGFMKTYFLKTTGKFSRAGSVVDRTEAGSEAGEWAKASLMDTAATKTQRLVEWNTESLLRLLQHVVASRGNKSSKPRGIRKLVPTKAPLGEVVEVISLPRFDPRASGRMINPEDVDLGPVVKQQLRSYISWVASMYNDNPFHSFEHASHVSMSVNKLLSRIIAPTDAAAMDASNRESALHDHTYGITSDPLVQFACAFSALIHDADHRGVPNGQLVVEQPALGELYSQSVAEQHSVDVCWSELMSDNFRDLRACIYSDEQELKRFRQVVVNIVLATDIFDKKLKALREGRWSKAFAETIPILDLGPIDIHEGTNRKATIVLEHIIQASDVSHTMQHWHVYIRWNERLYAENLKAFQEGRSNKDPTDGWYGGELWFYDNYVIPLAKKLAECGVFGVSSDEYLNYAQLNRDEWAQKGKAIVAEMARKYKGVVELPEQAPVLASMDENPTIDPALLVVDTEIEC